MSGWRIRGALRTPFGRAKGSLAALRPFDLARQVVEELLSRLEVDPREVDSLLLCTSVPEIFPPYPARVLSRLLGLKGKSLAFTVTEGAVAPFLALARADPETRTVLLVGADSASCTMGRRIEDQSLLDRTSTDPDSQLHLSYEAEEVAASWGFSRQELDSVAIESHLSALRARQEGRLEEEIFPVAVPPDYEGFVHRDQAVREKASERLFAAFPPVRAEAAGLITHGTIALPGDGAACVLLERFEGPCPDPVITGWGVWGVPEGEVALACGVKRLCALGGLELERLSALELHERSASHVLAALRVLGAEARRKLNRRGGALAFGDVGGATMIRHLLVLAGMLKAGEVGIAAAGSGGLCGGAVVQGASAK